MTATRQRPDSEGGQTNSSPDNLRRVLGVTGLVIFGLAYMDPMAVFDTYGVVSQTTHGHVPTAYLVTFSAMIFTAFSYAVLVRAFPSAGSTYIYARRAFGGTIGSGDRIVISIDAAEPGYQVADDELGFGA